MPLGRRPLGNGSVADPRDQGSGLPLRQSGNYPERGGAQQPDDAGGAAMASLMRALIIDDTKSASVRHVPVPVPGPRQVVVDVHRAGVCGTDVELFTRELPYFEQGKSSFPLCPGHEWCGTVSAIGAEVDPRWIGERVTGDTMLGCGHCPRCASGRHHVCADRSEIGIAGWPGALAEKLLVPVGSLYRLPAAVDDRAGALVEPGGNSWRAVRAAHAGPGRRLLVWGPGSIGLLAAAFAHAAGAEVHVAGPDAGREELAKSFGASRYWTSGNPPAETYDAVIDCTGDATIPALALRFVEPAGRVVYIGLSRKASLIDSRQVALNDLTVVGILGASAGLAPAIEHYADGRVDPGPLAQVVVGLDRAAGALTGDLDPGAGTKIHIDPRL
jgi:2-desacetyl-2-hydroxyethyl bacteriochlorophyllide A dehydrogenase